LLHALYREERPAYQERHGGIEVLQPCRGGGQRANHEGESYGQGSEGFELKYTAGQKESAEREREKEGKCQEGQVTGREGNVPQVVELAREIGGAGIAGFLLILLVKNVVA
jgi:hypothetical protein